MDEGDSDVTIKGNASQMKRHAARGRAQSIDVPSTVMIDVNRRPRESLWSSLEQGARMDMSSVNDTE